MLLICLYQLLKDTFLFDLNSVVLNKLNFMNQYFNPFIFTVHKIFNVFEYKRYNLVVKMNGKDAL